MYVFRLMLHTKFVKLDLREDLWHESQGCDVRKSRVGKPGDAAVSQGCVILRSTELHQRTVAA